MAKDSAELSDLNSDLRELLAAWFDVGLLELRQITWEAPAALLEKLIAYEAVHKIRSWVDMKNRQIGRASRRERGCQYVEMLVVAEPLKKKIKKEYKNKQTNNE